MKIKLLTFCLFIFSSYAFSFPKNWGDKRPLLLAPVKVDGATLTDIWLNPNQNDYIIDRRQTVELLNSIIKKEHLDKLKGKRIDKNYFHASDLVHIGIYLVFDPNELILYFKIPLDIRMSNSIDIGTLNQKKPLRIIRENPISGYLNLDYTKQIKDDKFTNDLLYYETNLNIKNNILNYGGSYNSANQDSKHIREHTRYIYDFKDSYSRLVLGDLNYKTVSFQTQINGLGLSFQREFSIVPDLVKSSFGLYTITLKKPSIVELFLNDARIYRAQHPAGILNLKNLPLLNGLNDVKVVLTDSSGRREEFNYQSPYHDTLLPQGMMEYSFNSFVESSFDGDDGKLSYNYDHKLSSSFLRYGLSNNKTIGVNAQTYMANNLIGLEYNTILPHVSLSIGAANSKTPKAEIKEARAYSISAQTITKPGLRKAQILASYQGFDEGFSTIKGAETALKSSYNLGVVTHLNAFLGMGISYEASNRFDAADLESANLETNFRLSRQSNISLSAKRGLTKNSDDSFFISFNWFEPKKRVSTTLTHDTLNKLSQSRVNYLKDYEDSKLQLSAGVDKQKDEVTSNVFVNYTNEYASFKFDQFINDKERRGKINTRFSLAFTNESFNLTNYIEDSFIIIDSNTDSPLYVGRSSSGLSGLVKKDKTKSITTLSPYRFNTFYINSNQLPFGEDLERLELTIYPSFKSGSYFKIETTKKLSVILKLGDVKGKNKYKKGHLYAKSGKKLQYIFTGKSSNVFLDEIKSGAYYIILDGSNEEYHFKVPNEKGHLNLGVIKVNEN